VCEDLSGVPWHSWQDFCDLCVMVFFKLSSVIFLTLFQAFVLVNCYESSPSNILDLQRKNRVHWPKVSKRTSLSLSGANDGPSIINSILSLADHEVNEAIISQYTPPDVTNEIWVGSIVSLVPIVYATIVFNDRIQIQRRCLVCAGSGLVYQTAKGNVLNRPRKCFNCGGFLPWLGWKMFFLSTFLDVGNGGVLQRPVKDFDKVNEQVRLDKALAAKQVAKGEPLQEQASESE
jgi:hypothetical protein